MYIVTICADIVFACDNIPIFTNLYKRFNMSVYTYILLHDIHTDYLYMIYVLVYK